MPHEKSIFSMWISCMILAVRVCACVFVNYSLKNLSRIKNSCVSSSESNQVFIRIFTNTTRPFVALAVCVRLWKRRRNSIEIHQLAPTGRHENWIRAESRIEQNGNKSYRQWVVLCPRMQLEFMVSKLISRIGWLLLCSRIIIGTAATAAAATKSHTKFKTKEIGYAQFEIGCDK